MGTLVFQANLGGAVNLIGPNTASTVNFTLPSADGTSGQALVTNGSGTLSFSTFTSGAAGSNTQVQFNSSGAFAGSANLTFDGTTLTAAGLSGPHNGTVGATTPNTGSFTTLTASSTTTLSGGTANGVAYLNGSKVVTTGSALVFDGTNLLLGISTGSGFRQRITQAAGNWLHFNSDTVEAKISGGSTWDFNSDSGAAITYSLSSSEKMRLTSTGLGIGTSSPSVKLHVSTSGAGIQEPIWLNNSQAVGAGVGARLVFTGTSSNNGLAAIDGAFAGATTADGGYMVFNTRAVTTGALTERMRLDSSGNLGLGVTPYNPVGSTMTSATINGSTYGTLYVQANGGTVRGTFNATTANNTVNLAALTNHPLTFATNDTERARIDSSGNLLVGKTSTGAANTGFQLNNVGEITVSNTATTNAGPTQLNVYSTAASAYRFYIGMGGTVYATSTTISAISDQRFKENIQDLDVGLNAVMALKPRKFDWKAGKGKDIKGDRGWIAQEFEQVFPDMIDTWKDEAPEGEEPYKSVRADLIPVLVKAIQELKAEFDAYKATHP